MQYLLLFLEGVITFISPCLLPMLPVYLSYFAAGKPGGRKPLANAAGFVLGFSAVFVTMGAFAGTAGRLLREYQTAFNLVSGAVVVLFGLNYLGIIRVNLFNRTSGRSARVGPENLGFLSSVAFGFAFSIGWTPCVGAFLGSALMTASLGGSVGRAMLMLLVFSLGLGLPFIASALLVDALKGAFDFIKRNYRIVNALSGGFLILIGLLMATGTMGRYLARLSF